MLRARTCSFCGGDMPASGRIDRRYCRPSCRTLAYRHRRSGTRKDQGSLLDVVRALEQRLSATAAELLLIRQRFSSELGHDAAHVTLASVVAAHSRDAAALKTALREQELQHQHLVELDGQRTALRSEVAELTQRVEQAQRAKQQREQELLDELRRQREYYESLSGPSWQSELPGQPPRAESVRPPIQTELPTAQAQPIKSSRSARAKPSLTQRSRESAKLNASRLEARSSRLERFAEQTLQRRLPEYIKVHRPDLRHDVRDELASGDGPLHHLARRLARVIDAEISRGQWSSDVPGLVETCVGSLYRQLASDSVERALCRHWPRDERVTVSWLAYQLVIAIMGDWGRLRP